MLRILAIPLALLGLLVGAVYWSGGGAGKRADFVYVDRGDIYTLDINQISYMQDIRLIMALREGLYDVHPVTLAPIPAGAVSHEQSADQRTWTFHLRKECRWSNGEPVTAKDYIFSWRRMLEEPGEYTRLFYSIVGAKAYRDEIQAFYTSDGTGTPPSFEKVGVAAPDDYTLVVKLQQPVPYLRDLLAFPPFFPRNEKSMEPFKAVQDEKTGQYTYQNQYTRPPHVVTNGAFMLTRWDFKRGLSFVQNPYYWDRAHVKSTSVEMIMTDNPLSQFLLYESGKIDWLTEIEGDLGAELRAQGRKDLRMSPAFGTAFLTLICTPELPQSIARQVGVTKNPLADVRVRQALAMSIDKRFIVENITRMGEIPARTYVPPDGTLKGYKWPPGPFAKSRKEWYTHEDLAKALATAEGLSSEDLPGLPYDVARAKRLLADAGYPEGRGFPPLPIFYGTNSPVRQKICQVLKNQWRANLGINIEIQGMEGKSYSDRTKNYDYAIAPVSWYGDYPDASTFAEKYLRDSDQNESAWLSKAYDDLCVAAAKEANQEKRLKMLSEAEDMLNREVPIIPLYYYVNASLARTNVMGVEANPRNVTVFKEIWVRERRGN